MCRGEQRRNVQAVGQPLTIVNRSMGSLKPARVTSTWTGDGARFDVVKGFVDVVS